jgi:cytoskeletal protein RodZ
MSEPENDVISSPPTPDDEPIEEEILTAPESEGKSFWARSLRWLLILAVIFGLGALLIMFILYIPARDQAILANQQIMEIEAQAQADLENADQKIAELEETIESLSVLEAQNVELQDELDMANLHVVILSARTDVATAQLTLAKGPPKPWRY